MYINSTVENTINNSNKSIKTTLDKHSLSDFAKRVLCSGPVRGDNDNDNDNDNNNKSNNSKKKNRKA